MEPVHLEATLGGNVHGHKRSDLDLQNGAVEVFQGGDAKRPRECAAAADDDASDMEMDEAHQDFQMYLEDWLMMYGQNGANSFEAETLLRCSNKKRKEFGKHIGMSSKMCTSRYLQFCTLQWRVLIPSKVLITVGLGKTGNWRACYIVLAIHHCGCWIDLLRRHQLSRCVVAAQAIRAVLPLQPQHLHVSVTFDISTADYPPMHYTDVMVLPLHARRGDTMEVFFVKVSEITGGLQWPLDVHGIVAVRDSLDRKRNYLFRRSRDNCQTLTSSQDSLLELTGPSRAILLWDEPVFEIDLKVKGKGSSSEDKILCLDVFGYNNISYKGNASYFRTKVVSSRQSRVEVRFAHLKCSVEATITVRICQGSGNFSALLTACNVSLGEDVVLLDTRGQEVSTTQDGEVTLQRRVVVVEDRSKLRIGIKAEQFGDTAESKTKLDHNIEFVAKTALRNEGYFNIGLTRLHVLVAWSLLL